MSHAAHGPNWPARIGAGFLSLVALALAIALAVTIGEMRIPLDTALKALGNGLFDLGLPVSPIQQGVIFDYRLSRALMAALCGGSLAISGAILQALLRNPLAEPYILGISAGASTGAVAVLILGVGGLTLGLSAGAFIGSCAALAVVALLASGAGGASDRVILSGVATSQLFNAATATIVTTLASAEQARGVMFWLLGNFGGVRWGDLWIATPIAFIGFGICMLHAKALDAFAFGADSAAALGVAVTRVRVVLFVATALMTAVMVSIVGTVGFVGLVIPHAARFLVGASHARLLPACLVGGALFMIGADILSRVLVPQQILPIGVVTALFGAPAFAVILYRARRPA
ncbi:iron ABC transporter permease [Bosea sp. (in: a-proteobacteria)]|uniref:FecCD family ABC transporter permease n=1 Tax=Bosea sp. (in: a-proteobacteria) TaxID=1871050 RepID=UPI0012201141|nr:iron ABC transporter permease [Bosea sp. (in: a-proteobacteria)]TAJ28388.1 MAG: iron ABC transporter permease [Bosea sp. (in: a-proteobacteria)]